MPEEEKKPLIDNSAKLPAAAVSQLDQAEAAWEHMARCIANYYNVLVAQDVPQEIAESLALNAAEILLMRMLGNLPADGRG